MSEVLTQELSTNAIAGEMPEQAIGSMLDEQLAATEAGRSLDLHNSLSDRLLRSNFGRAATTFVTALGVGGAGELLTPAAASASESTQVTQLNSDTTIRIGQSQMSESALSAVTVMTNDRTISKAEVKRLKGAGDCQVFNGNKVKIFTDGHVEGGGVAPGRDHRKSLFCHETNGSGWFRAVCGNHASINITPPHAIENVIWAGNKLKFKVTTRASATAEALCTTSDGLASAYAYGHGSGFATEKVNVRTGAKANAKGTASKLITKTTISASGQAKSQAQAEAVAVCTESGGTVAPKNSTEGPGSGIPTQPGGPGAGGSPGNGSGETCIDPANSTTDGDLNSDTSGQVMNGPHDQNGDCVGPAQPIA